MVNFVARVDVIDDGHGPDQPAARVNRHRGCQAGTPLSLSLCLYVSLSLSLSVSLILCVCVCLNVALRLPSRWQDRTIILTTHSMEEADILGDRIAIMCKVFFCSSLYSRYRY